MITVIVPTLWKYPPFLDYVAELTKVYTIGEIIIIDNDPSTRPEHPILSHNKVTLKDDENLYVNPAWNWGAANSKYEQLCFLNDDMIVDIKLFFKAIHHVGPKSGVTGLCAGKKEFNQPPLQNGSILFQPWHGEHTFGFGSLFFLHKECWIPIPEELKIYYGDNWVFDTQLFLGRTNELITDCLYHTPWAVTTSGINPQDWLQQEGEIYHRKLEEFKQSALTSQV